MGHVMTTFTHTPDTTVTDDLDTTTCDACGHPDSVHDEISRRFCRATMSQAHTRNCICSI